MHENPTWSTAYKNQLPDSAFLYVDKRACERTDREGRSHPLSCRHFPYRNHLGTVSLSHVRNAISRAPQSNLPPSVQRQVQQKARRLLDGEGRMAANTRHSDRTWFITDGKLALVLDRSGSEQLRPLLKGGRPPSGVVLFSRPEAESEIVAWRRSGHWPLFAHKARAENSRLANRKEGSSRRRGITGTMRGSVKRNPDPLSPDEVLGFIEERFQPTVTELSVPFVNTYISRLGRYPSLMFTISLDPKDQWEYRILENSRYAKFALHYEPRKAKWELEMISRGHRGVDKVRKYSSADPGKLDQKLQSLPQLMAGGSVKRNPGTSSIGPSPRRHLGKFDTPLDEAIYAASLDGFDDGSVGDATEPPFTHATLMRDGNSLAEYIDPSRARSGGIAYILNEQELDFLRTKGSAGVIVFVNSDGFVQVVYYDNAQEIEKDWAETEEKLAVENDGY